MFFFHSSFLQDKHTNNEVHDNFSKQSSNTVFQFFLHCSKQFSNSVFKHVFQFAFQFMFQFDLQKTKVFHSFKQNQNCFLLVFRNSFSKYVLHLVSQQHMFSMMFFIFQKYEQLCECVHVCALCVSRIYVVTSVFCSCKWRGRCQRRCLLV